MMVGVMTMQPTFEVNMPAAIRVHGVPGVEPFDIKLEWSDWFGFCVMTPWGMKSIKKEELDETDHTQVPAVHN